MRAALSSTQGINREELGFGPSSGVGPDTFRERSSFVGLVPVPTRPPKPRSKGVSGHLRVSSFAGLRSGLPGWPAADACDVGSAARSGKRLAAAAGYELSAGPRSRQESAAVGQHPRIFSGPQARGSNNARGAIGEKLPRNNGALSVDATLIAVQVFLPSGVSQRPRTPFFRSA
ncbi:hypothetical protein MTO96_011636 [Rhipicephalus appendiculatus]